MASSIKNILIIGQNGFLGKKITSVFKKYNKFKIISTNLRLNNLDELLNLIKSHNVEIIIHLASDLIPSSNEVEFHNSIDNLVIPTFKLIDYASKKDIKFVYFSSGGAIYGQNENERITEDSILNPINYYGYSKMLIENYILLKNKIENLSYLILRPSNIYGDGYVNYKNQGFIGVAINRILNGEELTIWGDGLNVKNYINVEDVTEILHILLIKSVSNDTFNICSDSRSNLSLIEIVKIIENISNKKANLKYIKPKDFDVKNIILSNDKLSKVIDYKFKSIIDGIFEQINCI